MTKHAQRRWHCPACDNKGWSTDGAPIPHDTPHGKSCRKSGQVSEKVAKACINAAIQRAMGLPSISAEFDKKLTAAALQGVQDAIAKATE